LMSVFIVPLSLLHSGLLSLVLCIPVVGCVGGSLFAVAVAVIVVAVVAVVGFVDDGYDGVVVDVVVTVGVVAVYVVVVLLYGC